MTFYLSEPGWLHGVSSNRNTEIPNTVNGSSQDKWTLRLKTQHRGVSDTQLPENKNNLALRIKSEAGFINLKEACIIF